MERAMSEENHQIRGAGWVSGALERIEG